MTAPGGILRIALGYNWLYALPTAEGLILIDAGPDYPTAWEELAAQLDVHGYRPADVRAVLVTHAHLDHAGLAAHWQSLGAPVWGAAAEAERFRQGTGLYTDGLEAGLPFLERCGVPAAALAAVRAQRERWRDGHRDDPRWAGPLRGTPFTPDRLLEGEDRIVLGGRSVRCLPTPGHTPGTYCFYEPASGVLFSGDHLLPDVTPNPGLYFTPGGGRIRALPQYARSLARVAALGARTLYPGHGEPSDDVAGAVQRTAQHHARRQQRLLRFLREGPQTPYALLRRFFPHLPEDRLWQAMAEVLGHIDVLVERGEAVEEEAGGLLSVRATDPALTA